VGWWILAAALCVAGGCSRARPATAPADTVEPERSRENDVERNPPAASGAAEDSVEANPVLAPPAPAPEDTVETPPPTPPKVAVEMDPSERKRLESQARADLASVERALLAASSRPRDHDSNETVATIRGLMDAARSALAESDVQAAATLAHKARLLADELP
jgi:hypothetical protein